MDGGHACMVAVVPRCVPGLTLSLGDAKLRDWIGLAFRCDDLSFDGVVRKSLGVGDVR